MTIDPGSGQVIGGVMPSPPVVPALASPDLVQAVGRNFQGVLSGMRVNFHVVDVLQGFPSAPGGLPFLIVPEQIRADAAGEHPRAVTRPDAGVRLGIRQSGTRHHARPGCTSTR